VRVQVQNGTGTDSLARGVVQFIASKGYPVDDLDTANAYDGAEHAQSEIIDMDGSNNRSAFQIATWLNIDPGRIRQATSAEKQAITGDPAIVVLLGKDGNFSTLIQSPTTSTPGG
jgi:hypothetical protein